MFLKFYTSQNESPNFINMEKRNTFVINVLELSKCTVINSKSLSVYSTKTRPEHKPNLGGTMHTEAGEVNK